MMGVPFKPGDRVVVINSNGMGKPIIEGWGKIVGLGNCYGIAGKHTVYEARVEFEDGTFDRVVSVEAQKDPEAYVAQLQKEWRDRMVEDGGEVTS
jgi:hypothetical protein